MNGDELKQLHDDVKELTIANKDLSADVRVLTTQVEIYLKDTEDHEKRIRRLEKGEKIIWGAGTLLATIIAFYDKIRNIFN